MTRRYYHWTNREVERLDACYPAMSRAELIVQFAPHPWTSIYSMARRRKLRMRCRDWKAIAAAHVMVSGYFRLDGVKRGEPA
jgi:hypothetical protein